ncbi:MAG: single-stranded DNA-binding protein [Sphaerochaetaceae bacterium]|nr:single-stranded DNA-binding protein [Sphaerochaetaceae bacterium]
MNQLNSVVIEGIVCQEPKILATSQYNNDKLVTFTIVNHRYYRGKEGEKKDDATFLDIQAWGYLAEKILEVPKGTFSRIAGRLRMSSWIDKNTGKKQHRIVVCAEHIDYIKKVNGKEEEVALDGGSVNMVEEPLFMYS